MQQEIFDDGSTSGAAASAVSAALSSAADALANATAANASAANATAGAAAPAAAPGTWLAFLAMLVYRALQLLLMGVLFIVYNLWRNQERMLYHPQLPGAPGRRVEDNPPPYHSPLAPQWGGGASSASGRTGLPYQEAFVRSSDGTPIHAWLLPAPPAVRAAQAPTLLLCHANAGNMGLRLPMADSLRAALSANIVMWDYRGYGASGGEPEEEGIKRDGEAVLAWARALPEVHPGRLFVVGESLGGAVAVHIAVTAAAAAAGGTAPPLAGLWLINTFTSISDMVDHLLPQYKVVKPYILRLRWDTRALLPSVPTTPILFVSGRKDKLVPPALMDALHGVARARGCEAWRTQFHEVPEGDHNDTPLRRRRVVGAGGKVEEVAEVCPEYLARARQWVVECLGQVQGVGAGGVGAGGVIGQPVGRAEALRVEAEREGAAFVVGKRVELAALARVKEAMAAGRGEGAGAGAGAGAVGSAGSSGGGGGGGASSSAGGEGEGSAATSAEGEGARRRAKNKVDLD